MPKVLIVDDEIEIMEACVEYLQLEGYEAYGAKNSKETFEAVGKYEPDVVLIDFNLHDAVSGAHIIKKIKELLPNVKTAILTGHAKEKIEKECQEAGVNIIIEKPIPVERLREVVDELSKT